jgi:GTP-binding protein
VSRPEVIIREIDGVDCEPYEQLTVDVEEQYQGALMEALGNRKADLKNILPDGRGRVRLDYEIPSRGLIGFQSEFMTLSSGTGLIYHVFDHYGAKVEGTIGQRQNGVLISTATGKALAYALFNLQERGRLMIGHAEPRGQSTQSQTAHQHPCRRHRRKPDSYQTGENDPRTGTRIHRRR